jgi:nucleotide-binding universal stress UspA family protein
MLVGVDFSARSRTAAELAVMLSQRFGADVEFVHVIESDPNRWENQILALDAERIKQTLEQEATTAVRDLKIALDCEQAGEYIVFGNAAQQITRRCAERQVDLLVIGDSGAKSTESYRGLGTTAYRLVEYGPSRLLVVKPSYNGKLDKVAAAIDYSPVSNRVLTEAVDIARITSAELFVIHAYSTAYMGHIGIVSGPSYVAKAMDQMKTTNDQRIRMFVEERLPRDISASVAAIAGPERLALADYLMQKEIDVVVLGTGTSARLAGYPIGSVTHGILNDTMSSVLVIRSHDQAGV